MSAQLIVSVFVVLLATAGVFVFSNSVQSPRQQAVVTQASEATPTPDVPNPLLVDPVLYWDGVFVAMDADIDRYVSVKREGTKIIGTTLEGTKSIVVLSGIIADIDYEGGFIALGSQDELEIIPFDLIDSVNFKVAGDEGVGAEVEIDDSRIVNGLVATFNPRRFTGAPSNLLVEGDGL